MTQPIALASVSLTLESFETGKYVTDTLAHILEQRIDRAQPLLLPESFCLERGIYGGLVMAVTADAIKSHSPVPLRAMQLNLCALALPDEPIHIDVCPKRIGKHTTSVSIELIQGDTIVAHGTGFCGNARPTQANEINIAAPKMAKPDTVQPVPAKGMLPPYTSHIELRPCWGEQLFSNGKLESGGWVRLRRPPPAIDEVVLSTLIDCWWPANLVRGLRPMATVSIQIAFLDTANLPVDKPLALTTQTLAISDGYATENDQLWTECGRLVASAQQVIAVIK